MRRSGIGLAGLALCLFIPAAALAEKTPVLAEYRAHSGSLPPQYAWSTDVTIWADGQLSLKHCKGHETEGPACTKTKARVKPAKLATITATARASGLAGKPASEASEHPIGGGTVFGRVTLDGKEIDLPPFPAKPDQDRVAKVLAAIAQAIPHRLMRHAFDGD